MPATKSARQAAAGQRRPRFHPVLLKTLRTAPATKSALQVHQVLCLQRNLHFEVHDATKYCACHKIGARGSPSAVPATKSARQAAAGQRRRRVHPVLLKALRTAPATKPTLQVHQALCLKRNLHNRQPRASGDHASTRSSSRLCVLRLPRNLHSRFTKCCACHEICT